MVIFKLIELRPNSPKFPIVGVDQSGTQYKFTKRVIKDIQRIPIHNGN